MDFVTPVIDIVSRLIQPIAQRVRFITKLEENVGSLRNSIAELIAAKNDVKLRVDAEESRLWKRTNQVNEWLQRVEATQGEVTQIENAFNQRRRCLGDCHPNFWSSYKLGKRVYKKIKDVGELKNQGVFSEVAVRPPPDPVTEMPSTSTVGMDLTMQKVLRYLREDEVNPSNNYVGIIGIVGMGGVGKTTLLTKINNQFLRSHDFDVVIWVVASQEPNLVNMRKAIGKKLGFPEDRDPQAENIFNSLKVKKFLILLDDIWARLNVEDLGIPLPNSQNKSKLLFTTRSEEVCGQMEARRKVKVECLAHKEAWDLFREKVGEEALNSHPDIPKLAEDVADKCEGLPLALITIGRSMASKKIPPEWKHAINVLGSSPGMKDEVFPRLRFSYDNLSDDIMKECFLYCSLFPEDYNIKKAKLIDYWIGEGFLDSDDFDKARDEGHNLIGRLKNACLLEDGGDEDDGDEERQVKMHDVIREMALWVASENGARKDQFIVKAGVHLTKPPMLEKWAESKRISLMENELEELPETPTCPNLLTLMLQSNYNLRKISDNFFKSMPLLKVLDLSHTSLAEFPIGISELVELRHLNLSRTYIAALPGELVNLVKLKCLDLSYTSDLRTISPEMLAKLSRLQVLNLKHSNWKVEGSDDAEGGLTLLAELESLKYLNELKIAISNVNSDSLNRFLGSQIFTKCIRNLEIETCRGLACFHLSTTFGNMKRLKELRIVKCNELEELIIDDELEGANRLLPQLEDLTLGSNYKLKAIFVSRGCLQNLRSLQIFVNRELKNVTWVLHLHNLERIDLWRCEGLEEIIGDEVQAAAHDSITFPRLKRISLQYLPELKSTCRHAIAIPSLQSLQVWGCPKLKRLPFDRSSNANNTLREISGQEEWWEELEWEDETVKSTFLPYFVPWSI